VKRRVRRRNMSPFFFLFFKAAASSHRVDPPAGSTLAEPGSPSSLSVSLFSLLLVRFPARHQFRDRPGPILRAKPMPQTKPVHQARCPWVAPGSSWPPLGAIARAINESGAATLARPGPFVFRFEGQYGIRRQRLVRAIRPSEIRNDDGPADDRRMTRAMRLSCSHIFGSTPGSASEMARSRRYEQLDIEFRLLALQQRGRRQRTLQAPLLYLIDCFRHLDCQRNGPALERGSNCP